MFTQPLNRFLTLLALVLITCTGFAFAKKPDWPTRSGSGVIGFGLVELEPARNDNGKYIPTSFVFEYGVKNSYQPDLINGQVMVIPAKAFTAYNTVPDKAFLTHVYGGNVSGEGDFHLFARIDSITQPGLYVVAYGPWDGILTFDEPGSMESYKISASAPDGGSFRWIDADAGDITVLNYGDMKTAGVINDVTDDVIVRLRVIRDKGLAFEPDTYRYGSFGLHPTALARVELVEAHW